MSSGPYPSAGLTLSLQAQRRDRKPFGTTKTTSDAQEALIKDCWSWWESSHWNGCGAGPVWAQAPDLSPALGHKQEPATLYQQGSYCSLSSLGFLIFSWKQVKNCMFPPGDICDLDIPCLSFWNLFCRKTGLFLQVLQQLLRSADFTTVSFFVCVCVSELLFTIKMHLSLLLFSPLFLKKVVCVD